MLFTLAAGGASREVQAGFWRCWGYRGGKSSGGVAREVVGNDSLVVGNDYLVVGNDSLVVGNDSLVVGNDRGSWRCWGYRDGKSSGGVERIVVND